VALKSINIDGTYWTCGTSNKYANYLRLIENLEYLREPQLNLIRSCLSDEI
jgi:hypothetical protein